MKHLGMGRQEDALTGARVLYWARWPHKYHGRLPPPSEDERSARLALSTMEFAYPAGEKELFDYALIRFNDTMNGWALGAYNKGV